MRRSILLCFIFCWSLVTAQGVMNDPEIMNAMMTPKPLVNGEGGVIYFDFKENLNDLVYDPSSKFTITICLLNITPSNGASSVGGTYASKFNWTNQTYSSVSSCLIGTLNQTIPGFSAVGELNIEFTSPNDVSCPNNQMGFTVNIQPTPAMAGHNDVTNDHAFDYTCMEWDCAAALQDNLDICTMLNTPLGTFDCDAGGASNQQECLAGTSLSDPADDCFVLGTCPSVLVTAIGLLESNYSGFGMSTDLQQNGLLPNRSPYADAKLLPLPINSPVYQDIVDWVWIELRDDQNPSIVVAGASGLLRSNGEIVDGDGLSSLAIYAPPAFYHVSLHHRNHLPIMSEDSIALSASSLPTVDFSSIALYGTNPAKILNFSNLLYGGDANGDRAVNAADRSMTWNDRNQLGYLDTDLNLDGQCNAADRSAAWNNRNLVAQIP